MAGMPTKPGMLGDWAVIHFISSGKSGCELCIHYTEGFCDKQQAVVKPLGPDFCKQCQHFSTCSQPFPLCSHSVYVPQSKAYICRNKDTVLYSHKCTKCPQYTTQTIPREHHLSNVSAPAKTANINNIPFTMCDIHAHVVFDVDDGSANLQMSLDLLRLAYQEGIRDMVCTFHSSGTKKKYNEHFDILKAAAQKENIPIHLYPGCEISCSPQNLNKIILRLNNRLIPTINHSPYALIEFDKDESIESILYCAEQLRKNTSNKFIIAHIEKYRKLEGNTYVLDKLKNMGFLFQINAYSLVKEKRLETRLFAHQLLNEKRVSFLGSDCLRTNHKPPTVQSGIQYVYEHCDKEYAQRICTENARQLLLNTKFK